MPLKGKDELMRKVRDRYDKYLRALALEAHGRLIRRTPVDTGRARSNWNAAIGAPDTSVDENRTIAGVGRSQSDGAKVIADFGAGDRLFITNSLPYIPELENGSSKQAPQGMVKITVAEMQHLADQIAVKIRNGS